MADPDDGIDPLRAQVLASRFVVMLDDLLEALQHHWPISAQGDSIDVVRMVHQHGGNPSVIPRRAIDMVFRENKSLVNSRTGRLDRGAIYETRRLQ